MKTEGARPTTELFEATPSLLEFLDAIYWDLSFYGSPITHEDNPLGEAEEAAGVILEGGDDAAQYP
jgi:hypothetical protein